MQTNTAPTPLTELSFAEPLHGDFELVLRPPIETAAVSVQVDLGALIIAEGDYTEPRSGLEHG